MFVEYFLDSLHTLPIIPKSELLIDFLNLISYQNVNRILLATIRYLAKCPCPRCLIPMVRISGLGTHIDEQRRRHMRIDTEHRREKVEISRKYIYEGGRGIKSKAVEDLLKEDSLVPTRVCSFH